MLGVDPALISSVIDELKQDQTLDSRTFHGRDYLFLPKMCRSEIYIASRILMMLRYPPQEIVGIDACMKGIERDSALEYARYKTRQFDRLAEAMREHIAIDNIYAIMRQHQEPLC